MTRPSSRKLAPALAGLVSFVTTLLLSRLTPGPWPSDLSRAIAVGVVIYFVIRSAIPRPPE